MHPSQSLADPDGIYSSSALLSLSLLFPAAETLLKLLLLEIQLSKFSWRSSHHAHPKCLSRGPASHKHQQKKT